jgi:hypothetical protein
MDMKMEPRKYWARLRLWWLFDYCLWHQERNFSGGGFGAFSGCQRCYDLREQRRRARAEYEAGEKERKDRVIARLLAISRGQA